MTDVETLRERTQAVLSDTAELNKRIRMLEAEQERRLAGLRRLETELRRMSSTQTAPAAVTSAYRRTVGSAFGLLGWLIEGLPWMPLLVLPLMLLKYCLFAEEPPAHRIEASGSVLMSEGENAPPLGSACELTATRPSRQDRVVDCEFHITCGHWFLRKVYACRENGYEVSSGEGDSSTEYYLSATSGEPGVEFFFHEQERVVCFSSEGDAGGWLCTRWRPTLHDLQRRDTCTTTTIAHA